MRHDTDDHLAPNLYIILVQDLPPFREATLAYSTPILTTQLSQARSTSCPNQSYLTFSSWVVARGANILRGTWHKPGIVRPSSNAN